MLPDRTPSGAIAATALVLFAHGARDAEWAEPVRRVRTAVCRDLPEVRVELAFLEFMKPSLRDCVERLVAERCQRIVVLPMFLARGGHLKRDIPLLVDELKGLHTAVCIELADTVGEAEVVVEAMARHARTLLTGC